MLHFLIGIGDHIAYRYIGPSMRCTGQILDRLGQRIAQVDYVEKCNFHIDNRSLRCVPSSSHIPDLKKANFVAPNSTVIGNVTTDKNSSIWYGSILKGNLNQISVGADSIVQDNVVIEAEKAPVVIGRNVFIAPNVSLNSCQLKDNAFVGMGAVIEEDCVIESYSIVAAGSKVPKKTNVPAGQMWAGSPAKFIRNVTPEERERINELLNETRQLAAIHSEEASKTEEQVLMDEDQKTQDSYKTGSEVFWDELKKLGYMNHTSDAPEIELKLGWQYYNGMDRLQPKQVQEFDQWRPFSDDVTVFPDSWKVYGEDMDRYERAKKMFEGPAPLKPEPSTTVFKPSVPNAWTKRY